MNEHDDTIDAATAARRANFEKGRKALADKRAAEKGSAPETPRPPPDSSLRDGARLFVRVCWSLSRVGARIMGRQLDALTDEEINEGAEEALPLLRRFTLIASLLAFLGFPFFLLRKLDEKIRAREPKKQLAAAPVLPPSSSSSTPNNVHPISASTAGP